MYIYITYFLIIMFATGVGSLSGMGWRCNNKAKP